jgi:hypothetical protein
MTWMIFSVYSFSYFLLVLAHWRFQELAREQSDSFTDNIITMEGYLLAREQNEQQAQLVKDAKHAEEQVDGDQEGIRKVFWVTRKRMRRIKLMVTRRR